MEVLGDDEMVMVLRYLRPGALLRIRAVCRRWRDLALHPDLWRRFGMYCSWHSQRKSRLKDRAVLGLAPCLDWLVLSSKSFEFCGVQVSSTLCAVKSLTLSLAENAAMGVLVLSNQMSLGRLKSLELRLEPKAVDSLSFEDLIAVLVQNTGGLEAISVKYESDAKFEGVVSLSDPPPTSSLKKLTYFSPKIDSLLKFFLTYHAQTLEEVVLNAMGHCKEMTGLLAAIPNLRVLRCPLLDDFHLLLQCRHLTSLTLDVEVEKSVEGGHALAGAEGFLRGAAHLTRLTLDYTGDSNSEGLEVNLVRSLASLRRPALTFLEITISDETRSEAGLPALQCPALAAALAGLTNLETLEFRAMPSDELFRAVRPDSVPHLTCFELESWNKMCPHKRVHQTAVQDMLRLHPGLKFIWRGSCWCEDLDDDDNDDDEDDNYCEFCKQKCHSSSMYEWSWTDFAQGMGEIQGPNDAE